MVADIFTQNLGGRGSQISAWSAYWVPGQPRSKEYRDSVLKIKQAKTNKQTIINTLFVGQNFAFVRQELEWLLDYFHSVRRQTSFQFDPFWQQTVKHKKSKVCDYRLHCKRQDSMMFLSASSQWKQLRICVILKQSLLSLYCVKRQLFALIFRN